MSCDNIKLGKACILEAECQKKHRSGGCEFVGQYENLEIKPSDPPLVREVKERMHYSFMENWKGFARDPKPGKKHMTGGAFEKAIRDVFREKLAPLGATVSKTGRKFGPKGVADICGNVDCLIEKKGDPSQ